MTDRIDEATARRLAAQAQIDQDDEGMRDTARGIALYHRTLMAEGFSRQEANAFAGQYAQLYWGSLFALIRGK